VVYDCKSKWHSGHDIRLFPFKKISDYRLLNPFVHNTDSYSRHFYRPAARNYDTRNTMEQLDTT